MKYFRMSYEEVVFRRSYINILLLNRSIPSYNFDHDDEEDEMSDNYTSHKKRKTHKGKPMHASDFFMQFM